MEPFPPPADPLTPPMSKEALLDSCLFVSRCPGPPGNWSCPLPDPAGVDDLMALTGTTLNGETDERPSRLLVLNFPGGRNRDPSGAGLQGTTKGLLASPSWVWVAVA